MNALVVTTALEAAANSVVITDINGIILWVNPAFTTLTGYPSQDVIGKNPSLLKSEKQGREFYEDFWPTILAGKTWRGEFTNRRKDGSLYQDEHTITAVRSNYGPITHFIAIMNDASTPSPKPKAPPLPLFHLPQNVRRNRQQHPQPR